MDFWGVTVSWLALPVMLPRPSASNSKIWLYLDLNSGAPPEWCGSYTVSPSALTSWYRLSYEGGIINKDRKDYLSKIISSNL